MKVSRSTAEPTAAARDETAGPDDDELTRVRWSLRRGYMEAFRHRRSAGGRRPMQKISMFMLALRVFGTLLRLTGQFQRGVRNALDVRLTRLELDVHGLPPAFEGFTLLHLSDLHVDAIDGLGERLVDLVAGLEVDALALTGDYRYRIEGGYDHVLPALEAVGNAVSAREGRFAILGNHDPVSMAGPLGRVGYRVLINETVTIERGEDRLHFVGIDDVHYYETEAAAEALRAAPSGFCIALVHSPEMVREAAEAGVALYLTGHTHGGQICLPSGRPIIVNAASDRRHASGLWRHGAMIGYTSPGAGVSGLPVRFFSRGEATIIVLRRSAG